MQILMSVILPVFLVIGFGYVAVWKGLFSDSGVDALMKFTQNFAIPCLLFKAISNLDLGQSFDASLLASFYLGAISCFLIGIFGARLIFKRPWMDCVAIGFCTLFSNTVLLGIPITERAYGAEVLKSNYAIVALHAPICYGLGLAVMETVRAKGAGFLTTLRSIIKAVFGNALIIGIMLGFVVNLTDLQIPTVVSDAVDMMVRASLPPALFGLGGILVRYRPEGDMTTIAFICAVSLILHPTIVWTSGTAFGLTTDQLRSAVLTASMAPGVNTYIFANMYGVARRVTASAVLIATACSLISIWVWLSILP